MTRPKPPQPEKTSSFKKIIGWVGGITAILGLLASLSGGVQRIRNHWTQHNGIKAEMAVAKARHNAANTKPPFLPIRTS